MNTLKDIPIKSPYNKWKQTSINDIPSREYLPLTEFICVPQLSQKTDANNLVT